MAGADCAAPAWCRHRDIMDFLSLRKYKGCPLLLQNMKVSGQTATTKMQRKVDERWMHSLREGKTKGLEDDLRPQKSSGVIKHHRRVQRRA